jgi:hypothetical protein
MKSAKENYRRDTGEDAIISASLFVDEGQNRQKVFTFVECSRMEAEVQALQNRDMA